MAERSERTPLSLKDAIVRKNLEGRSGIIAEFKRKSPSKGSIAPFADVADIAVKYQNGGAAAISVLTDTRYFGGALTDLALARAITDLPILRKDFIIDPIQIAEAKVYGSDAILLIASLLTSEEIKTFSGIAHDYQLSVLLEIHDKEECAKICGNPDVIGVNNRALRTFKTDPSYAAALISKLPGDAVKIAESGIRDAADAHLLREAGYNGFLIGETLMKAENPVATLIALQR